MQEDAVAQTPDTEWCTRIRSEGVRVSHDDDGGGGDDDDGGGGGGDDDEGYDYLG